MLDAARDSLNALFAPQSIAVIGASSNPHKIGGLPIAFLKAQGFEGPIYPVNPKATEIQGLPAFADIRDVPGSVDLAVCSVPSHLAEDAVQGAADKGVRAMIMFTAGFAEVSDEGADKQSRLARIARDGGMRLVGPNCVGMANLRTGAVASFHPAFARSTARDGSIGIVSQSGAFGGLCAMMAADRGVPFAHVITTGNEADIEAADGLMFLAEQPHVDVILLYVEGVRDGPRFLEGLRLAHQNGKAVIAIKLGKTDVGSEAAASHTAALAGSDEIYQAVFDQYGVHRAQSIEEFLDIACAAAIAGLPRNNQAGVVTVSGGVGVLMADDAVSRGLDLPVLPEKTQARMKELVPFAGVRNPLDVTGQVMNDLSLLDQSIDLLVSDTDLGSVHVFQGATMARPDMTDRIALTWRSLKERHPESWFALTGLIPETARPALDAAGIPTFAEPTHATRAAGALSAIRAHLETPLDIPMVSQSDLELPEGALSEMQSLDLLKQAGLEVMPACAAADAEAAVAAAEAVGYPVVLKALSPDILHKSDIGGVRLKLADADAVRTAFNEIMAAVKQSAPEARIDGCLVAPMIGGGVETILGVTRDPVFGPVVMFGLGGIFVEVMEDVSFRVAPFGIEEAQRMIDETKGSRLLEGVRGAPPADRDVLAKALSDLSRFAAAHADEIESMEANPFVVMPKGRGALALDAVVIPRTKT